MSCNAGCCVSLTIADREVQLRISFYTLEGLWSSLF